MTWGMLAIVGHWHSQGGQSKGGSFKDKEVHGSCFKAKGYMGLLQELVSVYCLRQPLLGKRSCASSLYGMIQFWGCSCEESCHRHLCIKSFFVASPDSTLLEFDRDMNTMKEGVRENTLSLPVFNPRYWFPAFRLKLAPLVQMDLRPSDLNLDFSIDFHRSLACRQKATGLPSIHNHVRELLVINLGWVCLIGSISLKKPGYTVMVFILQMRELNLTNMKEQAVICPESSFLDLNLYFGLGMYLSGRILS